MKVTARGEAIKYIEYGKHILLDTDFAYLKVMGSG